VGNGWGVSTVDVADPSKMVVKAESKLMTDDWMRELTQDGGHLFHLGDHGLSERDPGDLSVLGSYAVEDKNAWSNHLAVDPATERACYSENDAVMVLDLTSTPPTLAGSYATDFSPSRVACRGDLAVVQGVNRQTQVEYLALIDLTDPAHGKELGRTTTGRYYGDDNAVLFDGTSIFVAGEYWYNDQPHGELDIYQLSGTELAQVGRLAGVGARTMVLEGSELVFSSGATVGVVDVSNPASPTWRKHFAVPGGSGGMAVSDWRVFAPGDALSAIDLRLGQAQTLLATPNADFLSASEVVGGIAYLAVGAGGLLIEDIRDPQSPVVMSRTQGTFSDVKLRGHLAYLTAVLDHAIALLVYDVADPWAPELVGKTQIAVGGWDSPSMGNLSLTQSRAYSSCSGKLCAFDLTDPGNPTLIHQDYLFFNTVAVTQFSIAGDQLYVPGTAGLTVFDLTDLSAIKQVGSVKGPDDGQSGGVAFSLAGDKAYLATLCDGGYYNACFYVFDVANPTAPALLGSTKQPHYFGGGLYPEFNASPGVAGLSAHGSRAYVSNLFGGVIVYDVSVSASPKVITELWTPMPARRLFETDRALTIDVAADFPYPDEIGKTRQVVELCHQ
jgi:hypothetical protein